MFKILIGLVFVYLSDCYIVIPGPRYPPTKGEVWPIPQVENKSLNYYNFLPEDFQFFVTSKTCDLLTNAISRYQTTLRKFHDIVKKNKQYAKSGETFEKRMATDPNYLGKIKQLNITLTQDCEDMPYDKMFEGYSLDLAHFDKSIIELKSTSIWGIIRGLETFSQLFYFTDNFSDILVNSTTIIDYPEYQYRGLLLDTSRHYITIDNILTLLEGMAMNKMNVFHWHIVDDESFPYQSEVFPELSKKGAFHPSMIYTIDQVKSIINFAKERGIRVLPEFDVPGHTSSWGSSYPGILTKCYSLGKMTGLGPMNPIINDTYTLIDSLLKELQNVFPDKYFHLGGDEVDLSCWKSNPEIIKYMMDHNVTSASKLHGLFMEKVIPLLKNISRVPIVWQEVFDEGVSLSNDTLVQIWKSKESLKAVLKAGYKAIYSESWYLDSLQSGGDWVNFYNANPKLIVGDENLSKLIHGGAACMWGEVVDDRNVISRVWPRASAAAERLWSSRATFANATNVIFRLEEMTCRMIRRGINAQPPTGPGFCFF